MTNNQGDRLLRGYLSSRLLLVVIGIITPIGILVVNGAAFVMRNLAQFRIGIAVCALISSLVLNGLTASWLLRLAARRSIAIYVQHQEWATIIATIVPRYPGGGDLIARAAGAPRHYVFHPPVRERSLAPKGRTSLSASGKVCGRSRALC
ncbi:MAG: hypothetical protein E6I43_09820 [Chloroflexi bacterium]|nr:MAG: hypothetical protein E6I43_09820 [Chloroflexota bacterium]